MNGDGEFKANEIWKDQHGMRKKSESPMGIEPVTSRTPGEHWVTIKWARKTHEGQGHFI